MRNEKMERIINIEDSVIKHSHQDTVSHILVVHQGMLCLCEFIIGFYIAMLLLNLRMIGNALAFDGWGVILL